MPLCMRALPPANSPCKLLERLGGAALWLVCSIDSVCLKSTASLSMNRVKSCVGSFSQSKQGRGMGQLSILILILLRELMEILYSPFHKECPIWGPAVGDQWL